MLNRRSSFKKTALLVALAGALGSQSVHAANWLMLQGTEADHQAPRANVWGFAQINYEHTADTKLPNGEKAAFNQMAPQLTSSSGFNVRRARLGVRGANLPLDNKINYFLMAELGNNGITTGGNASQGQLVDASITLNHIPGARIRVGLFKTPGSEESFKAIPVFNYVNFTSATDRLLLERSFNDSAGNKGRNGPVSAFRDTGVQVFDAFQVGDWEHSYALMVGNGGGLAMTDKDSDLDTYVYLSTEKVFGEGAGPRRHGMKFYAWMHNGKRTIDGKSGNKRNRSGLGTTYFDGKYRMAAEYIHAEGMIYGGTQGGRIPSSSTIGSHFEVQVKEEAKGYHLDLGYRVVPDVELNIRYDALDSGGVDKKATLREFRTTTLGAQYFLNRKTSLRLNYEIRDIDAPNSNATAKGVVDSIDDRVSAQLMMIF